MPTIIMLARLFIAGFSMSLRRTLTFRTNLFFDVLLAVAGLLSALATVLLVFTQTDRLAGWTRPETLVLAGTFQILTGIKATFIDPNLSWFPSRGIRQGTLDVFYSAGWELGRYPTDIYRRPIRLLLTYVLPLTLIATLPASVLLRQPRPAVILASAAAGVAAIIIATGVWRLGLRRYTGATS